MEGSSGGGHGEWSRDKLDYFAGARLVRTRGRRQRGTTVFALYAPRVCVRVCSCVDAWLPHQIAGACSACVGAGAHALPSVMIARDGIYYLECLMLL